jgi:peptide/nickel transport system substrate-binding protein
MKGGRRSQIADRYLAQIVKRVKVIGPHQLKIFFKKPLNKPLKWLQFKIIPKHKFKGKRVTRLHYFSQKPIGTGPFIFKKWRGRKIHLERYKGHWRKQKARLKGVTLAAVPDKDLQVQLLRFGGLDAIIRVRPKDVAVFERDQARKLVPYQTNDWWYLGLNQKRGSIFRDKRVRQAFVYALDRDAIRSSQLGEGQTISGPFSPNDPLYNFQVTARAHSLSKANRLLDQAGWKRAGSTGFRKKGGKVLQVDLVLPKSKSSYKKLVLALQGAYRKIGVKLNLVWIGTVKWRSRVFGKKNYDMTLHIWNFDDLSTIYPLFHSRGSRNYISYRSKLVDKLLRQSTKTTDPAIYQTIFKKLHKVLHDDVPYIFLWSLTNYSALSSRIRRTSIHPFNYFHYVHMWKKLPQ